MLYEKYIFPNIFHCRFMALIVSSWRLCLAAVPKDSTRWHSSLIHLQCIIFDHKWHKCDYFIQDHLTFLNHVHNFVSVCLCVREGERVHTAIGKIFTKFCTISIPLTNSKRLKRKTAAE